MVVKEAIDRAVSLEEDVAWAGYGYVGERVKSERRGGEDSLDMYSGWHRWTHRWKQRRRQCCPAMN